jgi:hypothetical protein
MLQQALCRPTPQPGTAPDNVHGRGTALPRHRLHPAQLAQVHDRGFMRADSHEHVADSWLCRVKQTAAALSSIKWAGGMYGWQATQECVFRSQVGCAAPTFSTVTLAVMEQHRRSMGGVCVCFCCDCLYISLMHEKGAGWQDSSGST